MSDLETLKAMLLRAGYSEKPGAWGGGRTPGEDGEMEPDESETDRSLLNAKEFAIHRPAAPRAGDHFPQSIELGPGSGYRGFAVSLHFDSEGNLVGHAAWE